MPYPAIYRAKAVRYEGGVITAYVPQVFGDVTVEITDTLGDVAPGMGWVFFQAGNPEFPVWTSGMGGGGLPPGDWDLTNEVFISIDEPVDPKVELWYDPNATSSGGGSGGGGGPGVAVAYVHNQGTPAATWTIVHPLTFQPNVTVVDSAGEQVEGEVDYGSLGTVIVRFSAAFSGIAYLS